MVEVYAPGVLKLNGEYAVIWGGTAVGVAVDAYAKARVENLHGTKTTIVLEDYSNSMSFMQEELKAIYYAYRKSSNIEDFIKDQRLGAFLTYSVIAGRLQSEFKVSSKGLRITMSSQGLPEKSGFASSTAFSTAFATGLIAESRAKMSDSEIIDVARDGDRLLHRSKGAGKIDVSTSFYGGCVSYSDKEGAQQERLNGKLSLVTINVGPKPPAGESVAIISQNRNDPGALGRETNRILNGIDQSAKRAISALKQGDKRSLGNEMLITHSLLRGLGVSSTNLDMAVETAMKNGAYGAKLSGSGKGGAAIALADDTERVLSAYKRLSRSFEEDLGSGHYGSTIVDITTTGAKSHLNAKKMSINGA